MTPDPAKPTHPYAHLDEEDDDRPVITIDTIGDLL